jgi:DNA-binding NtrC family response regulator
MGQAPQSFGSAESARAIIGQDPALRTVLDRAARVAPTRVSVLISGESGTGKELLARLIHQLGPTPVGPFVAVNCGTLPRELADSELFGHERGAFTGAGGRKTGWFEEADGGTLVLDEVGELPLDLQPKLLRVLETGRVRRVGGSGEVPVCVRVVAMTLRDLPREIDRGTFRIDLYHRIAGFELSLPPLRRRRPDIPLLVERFLVELRLELGPRTIDGYAVEKLFRHDWPGNVRELRNVVHRAYVMTEGDTIQPQVIAELLPGSEKATPRRDRRAEPPKEKRKAASKRA